MSSGCEFFNSDNGKLLKNILCGANASDMNNANYRVFSIC